MSALAHSHFTQPSINAVGTSNREFQESPRKPLPLTKRDIEAFTTSQNYERTNQTQTERLNGSSDTIRIDLDRYLPLPVFTLQPRESFQALQKWEGHVLEVSKETFLARLTVIHGEGQDQEAEIYLEEIDEADRALIEPGAVFYWSIGYLDRPSGRMRASMLRLRRLPNWAKRDLLQAEGEAEQLKALFADE